MRLTGPGPAPLGFRPTGMEPDFAGKKKKDSKKEEPNKGSQPTPKPVEEPRYRPLGIMQPAPLPTPTPAPKPPTPPVEPDPNEGQMRPLGIMQPTPIPTPKPKKDKK